MRVRTTAAAVLVLGVALLGASFAMVTFVERSLTAQVADAADLRAVELAAALAAEPASGVVTVVDATEEFVQVLQGGEVVAASENVEGLPPLATPAAEQHLRLPSVPFVEGPFIVVSAAADGAVVVVGRNIDDEVEARRTVRRALFIGVPLLLVVVALVTWWIVGRALRPVEDIREEVERISARELDRRVPDAPGEDEVSRLALTMNRMLDRLQRSQERQRRFVSDASHELRSPIAAIRQHAEVAIEHPEAVGVGKLGSAVRAETDRLQDLVEDLLLLARLDEGAEPATVEVDLDDLVLAEAARLRATTSIEVDVRGVAATRVRGTSAQVERLVRNLVQNAARHANARIALGVGSTDGRATLSVEDDGPGIPLADRDRVFQRFVRLDEDRGRTTGGSGLGLAIVHEVAAAHGGDVVLGESALGGLRVDVHLPLAGSVVALP